MRIPTVGELMTVAPKTIGEDIPISTAKKHMKTENFRHLPVLKNGRLVGIISDRDIKLAESFVGKGELTVGEIMTPEPYVVGPDEPVDLVMDAMAERKYGCALIQDFRNNILIGIFTDTDALRFSGRLLRKKSSKRTTQLKDEIRILKQNENLLIVHRRLFESDEPRFFLGQVENCNRILATVTGYSWFHSPLAEAPVQKEGIRTKIISLTSGTLLIYLLPIALDISKAKFEIRNDRLWLRALPNFELDLTESYLQRSERRAA